ncbi:MAG: hypothetical protein U1D30_02080 [Planctomycetota bacterium]
MNGIIRSLGKSIVALATLAVGCQTLEKYPTDDVSCERGQCGSNCKGCEQCGGEHKNFVRKMKDKWKRFDKEQLHTDHCWPEQFSRESARRVNAPFREQMNFGNDIELTVWEHYFEDEDGKKHELNFAGKERIQYLARKKPFVIPQLQLQTSFDQQLDAKRIEEVLAYANKVSFEPAPWQVAVVNRSPNGLFGPEGPKAINKMIGPAGGPPVYEPNVKQTFLSTNQQGFGR